MFIGGNLSEERFSPEPPSKDFYTNFSLTGRTVKKNKIFHLPNPVCPVRLKLNTKVLGKEFEEEPFFKRVFLNKRT